MITELRAQNFKSWQDTGKLQFAPLTGLFGANSSGKTSILQILLMLKQTAERSPDWNEPLYFGDDESPANLGNFGDIIYQHRPDLNLEMSVSWEPIKSIYIAPRDLTPRDGVIIKDLNQIRHYPEEPKKIIFSTNITPRAVESFYYETPRNRFYVPRSNNLFRCYGYHSTFTEIDSLFLQLEEAFENLFSRILYLGPLREYPRHTYTWEGDHPEGVGQYGEKAIPAMLSGRVRLLSIDEQIPKWLQQLELIDSYRLHPISDTGKDYEFLVKKHKDGPEVRLTDVGFGVSQVLPVLIHCYSAPQGSILILEQPEAHLHPKVQSELADVLIDVVKNRNVQIILESHSEHLLHRLQRRIAEEQISADDTALYFCQINDGTSEIEQLDVDEYGNIRNWPQNFFGDDMGDLVEKTKAEMNRRKVME